MQMAPVSSVERRPHAVGRGSVPSFERDVAPAQSSSAITGSAAGIPAPSLNPITRSFAPLGRRAAWRILGARDDGMISDALASRLALDRLRHVGRFPVRRPVAGAARARPGGIKRLARRIGRHLPARRSSAARVPRGGF
jgi:hypothetical protein